MVESEAKPDFSAAIGRRFDSALLLQGVVKPERMDLLFPEVPRITATGAPMPMFSILAREHPWDIGEQAFSTYLMAVDAGKPIVALPVFPSRFFPHTGAWVARDSGIGSPSQLEGRRMSCNSFGTNYSVWLRGALTHQYDVATERIIWVESIEEHLPEFRPPRRFLIDRIPGDIDGLNVLLSGKVDAASLTGSAMRADPDRMKPLFGDCYGEIATYIEANGFVPPNTVISVRRDALDRLADMPRLLLDAYRRAKALYDAEILDGKQDMHQGISLRRLREVTGMGLPDYGFQINRRAIQTMIAYCYEQGIIQRIYDPEELFLLTDT